MTASDVENYKQIKSDLDELRNLVEKSELWVYKDKKGDEPKKKKKTADGKKVNTLTLSLLQTKTDSFANSADPDEMARNEPSHLDLHCLPFY